MSGTVWGIGVGPGDPELMTAKAIRLVSSLPVLAWPAPLQGDGLARTIAAPFIAQTPVEIAIRLSFAPDRADTDQAYDQAAAAIADHLGQGRDVGVLCEGDPLFFGSFLYLMDRLRGRFAVKVVPGIASPMAAAAAALHPLTRLDDRLVVIPATLDADKIQSLLAQCDCAVIMKVGRHLPKVKAVLAQLNLLDQAILVERATQAQQAIHPLAQMDQAPYFSLILVHA